MDSGATHFGPPPASLLALARGEPDEQPARPRTKPLRALWFCLGLLVGAGVVWSAKGDVRADVYRARMWVASHLRAMRPHGKPIASVDAAPGAAGPAIPTVDVADLPREGDEATAKPSAPTPQAPAVAGSPALRHAPGPR
jgi:hypothetical protein